MITKKLLTLPFSDEGDSPMFWDKTLAIEVTMDAVAFIKKMSEDCKQKGYAEISKEMVLPNWTIDADLEDIAVYQEENPVNGRDANILAQYFGNLRDHYGMADYPTVSVDTYGNVYFELPFCKVTGEGSAQMRIKDLLEMFPGLPEEVLEISREDFMSFWRSDRLSDVLTADDRMEIFASAPVGATDITKEVLDKILGSFGVENLRITDTSAKHTLDMVLGKTDKANYRYVFDSEEEEQAFLCGMDEVFGYDDYEIVEFCKENTDYKKKIIPPKNSWKEKRLAENNMLFRVGDYVEMVPIAQDDDHEEFLSGFRGDVYIVARVDEETETYLLKHQLAHTTAKKGFLVFSGKPAKFYDSDLSLVEPDEFRADMLIPLAGRFKSSLGFNEIVSFLQRPYVQLPKEYEDLPMRLTSYGLNGKRTDFILYRGKICTFGNADDGVALMPLRDGLEMKMVSDDFPENLFSHEFR
jgi:hypothetical protein